MTKTKLEPLQGMVLFAKNKKRVSAFYQKALKLKAVESEVSHDLLRGGGYEIVVHAIPWEIAVGIEIARPPHPREHAAIKPTFVVKSLDNVRKAARRTGGSLKPVSEAWSYRGYTLLDGMDPEGNQLQFKQRAG